MAVIEPYLVGGDRIVDIGCGSCGIAALLRDKGLSVTPLDITNQSCVPGLAPIIFDGWRMPFRDDAFDVGLLSNVLHHVHDPSRLLQEAARVSARRIVVHEDIYGCTIQKYLTFAMDSIVSRHVLGHPHANRSDAGWRELFATLGLTLRHARYIRFWRLFMSATYCLERWNTDLNLVGACH